MTLSTLVLLSVCLLLLSACRGEETHEAKIAQLWKEDSKACDKYASDRQKARELLAYDPEAPRRTGFETAEERRVRVSEVLELSKSDREACLRAQGWSEYAIEELTQIDRSNRREPGTTDRLPQTKRPR
jgi:hypothetical protein